MLERRVKILAFCALICCAVLALLLFYERSERKFDSAEWKKTRKFNEHYHPRLSMANRLIADHSLDGKTREEVTELLGQPSHEGYFRSYDLVYWLGPERSWISIDSEWLVIKLDDTGDVKAYKLERD